MIVAVAEGRRGAWSIMRLLVAWASLLVLVACTAHAPPSPTGAAKSGPNDSHLTAVLVAGDASITAFDDAIDYLHDMLLARGLPPEQIHMLSARGDRPATVEPARLATAIAQLDAVKPAADGSCLVFLTSHGAPEQGFYLADDDALMPPILDRALATGCGSAPTVVIVSACYSGQFAAAPMLKPNRIILTAAAADRSSFGCEAGATYTFFDECLLGALPNAPTWRTVYERARGCVSVRERQIDAKPSDPQGYFGADVATLAAPFHDGPDKEPAPIVFHTSTIRYSPELVPLPSGERRRLTGELTAYGLTAAPKAMAITPSSLMVWTYGGQIGSTDQDEVARLALQRCEFLSGGACMLYALGDQVTDLLPSGLAPLHPEILARHGKVDAESVPFIRPDQRALVEAYLKTPSPKALAVSPSDAVMGIGSGANIDAARADALGKCQAGGHDCLIYAEGDQVVLGWND